MSRILLLLVLLLWMAGASERVEDATWESLGYQTAIFGGVYLLLIFAMRAWSMLLSRRLATDSFDRSVSRFQRVMLFSRFVVPVWFGVALYSLSWATTVYAVIGAVLPERIVDYVYLMQSPALLLGTLPAFLAWVGLWWAQYPADRALREQNLAINLEAGLPVNPPPGMNAYILSNLRLQIFFTAIPVLLIIVLRDIAALAMIIAYKRVPSGELELVISGVSAGLIFLLAPEILRHVLHTQPLPASPLRARLDALCRRAGMRYRNILLWKTHNNMGNAAVMGVIPQVRYILLSDLLIEQMDDEQIEAVFAHEVGHVVHRHMSWFVVLFVFFTIALAALEQAFGWRIAEAVDAIGMRPDIAAMAAVVASATAFLLLLGFVSRRFERQADVYAARTIEGSPGRQPEIAIFAGASNSLNYEPGHVQTMEPLPQAPSQPPGRPTHVGRYGAMVFASALQRVALINNIPIRRRKRRRLPLRRRFSGWIDDAVDAMHNWFHGSIASRMDYVHHLSNDPALTMRFDRKMLALYAGLLMALAISAAVWWVVLPK